MDRKAQGMSLNMVIVAVLALVILIVLVLVFSGKLKLFGAGTSDTASQYSNKCAVPGTNNECVYDNTACQSKGGSFQTGKYSDCEQIGAGGCCLM